MATDDRSTKAKRESKRVEFKEELDVSSSGAWCELIKDIVALANSGGGVIIVGVRNNGTPSQWDPKPLLEVDSATLVDKLAKYTGRQFDQFDIQRGMRAGYPVAVITIGAVDMPMVFERPGTYEVGGGRQKTAFGQGTLFFRHGAKSEPANYADMVEAVNGLIERRRRLWFKNIRRVIEAEPGDTVQVVRPPDTGTEPVLRGRIVDDRNAMPIRPEEADSLWPNRQTDVIKKVNAALAGETKVTSYDIQAVKNQFEIAAKHPEFVVPPIREELPSIQRRFRRVAGGPVSKGPQFLSESTRLDEQQSLNGSAFGLLALFVHPHSVVLVGLSSLLWGAGSPHLQRTRRKPRPAGARTGLSSYSLSEADSFFERFERWPFRNDSRTLSLIAFLIRASHSSGVSPGCGPGPVKRSVSQASSSVM
jgi:hypothetical protein